MRELDGSGWFLHINKRFIRKTAIITTQARLCAAYVCFEGFACVGRLMVYHGQVHSVFTFVL